MPYQQVGVAKLSLVSVACHHWLISSWDYDKVIKAVSTPGVHNKTTTLGGAGSPQARDRDETAGRLVLGQPCFPTLSCPGAMHTRWPPDHHLHPLRLH